MVHSEEKKFSRFTSDLYDSEDEIEDEIETESDTEIIYPEFTVDDDGIPYCKTQTDYEKIVAMDLKHRFPSDFEKMLTCFHCDHYKNDECYFPKETIDQIETDRLKNRWKCELCGMQIDRLFSILMSLYYKDQYGVTIPTICCSCYAALERGDFLKSSKRRMILFGISLFTSLYFLFTYLVSVMVLSYWGILLFIIPFMFWGYISIRDMKNLYYLHKGRKYYDKLMGAASADSTNSTTSNNTNKVDVDIDSNQTIDLNENINKKEGINKEKEDDNGDKTPEGAYYSPGYEY